MKTHTRLKRQSEWPNLLKKLGTLSTSIHKASITLIPKPDKENKIDQYLLSAISIWVQKSHQNIRRSNEQYMKGVIYHDQTGFILAM